MLPLGTPAPAFRLPVAQGGHVALEDFADAPALLVAFLCNHCPYVVHIRDELARLGRDLQARGVAMVGISSNDTAKYVVDDFEHMKVEAAQAGYAFPYALDETQEVAQAYRAACTPDFFLFDAAHRLVYRGQLDSSRPGSGIPVTGEDLRAAVDAVLAGTSIPEPQRPSIGCNIKWKPGNEPEYFG